MASFEFDNVKAEKEDALWRYNMERKLRIGLRFCGFSLALFLLCWSWFPTLIPDTVGVAGDYYRRFVAAFNKPLFIFGFINIIIVAVYFLSNKKQTHTQHDLYCEYVSYRQSIPASAVAPTSPVPEEAFVDKQIVLVENAAAVSPVKQQPATVDIVTETKRSISPVKKAPTVVRTAETKPTKPAVPLTTEEVITTTKEYRRSRSMVSEYRNHRPPREFRRSETAISRELVISGGAEPPRKSMDEMSSEEFRSTIDSFIAETKKTLMQENTAPFTRGKEKCMSIVVKN